MSQMNELPLIGKNVHELRKKVNLSLDALANLSGVSKAMLSQIEQGKVNPTIATMWKIAKGLSVDFNSLLGNPETERLFNLQRHDTSVVIWNPEKSCEIKILTPPQMVDELEQYWLTFEPAGALVSDPHFHGTEEIVTVLEGKIELKSGNKQVVMEKGDCIRFHADLAHSIREVAGIKSQVYMTVYFKEGKKKN